MAYVDTYWDRVKTCPVCGKTFLPAIQHSYKIRKKGNSGHDKLACSYHCVREFEKSDQVRRYNKFV